MTGFGDAEKDAAADGLREAAAEDNVAALKAALAAGLPVDVRDSEGWTPLMWAAASGSAAAGDCLIRHGADVDARGHDGMTALMCCAATGDAALIKILLAAKADPFLQTDSGKTAGDIARASEAPETAALIDAVRPEVALRRDIQVRAAPLRFKVKP